MFLHFFSDDFVFSSPKSQWVSALLDSPRQERHRASCFSCWQTCKKRGEKMRLRDKLGVYMFLFLAWLVKSTLTQWRWCHSPSRLSGRCSSPGFWGSDAFHSPLSGSNPPQSELQEHEARRSFWWLASSKTSINIKFWSIFHF